MDDNPDAAPAPLWFRLLLISGVITTMVGLTRIAASE